MRYRGGRVPGWFRNEVALIMSTEEDGESERRGSEETEDGKDAQRKMPAADKNPEFEELGGRGEIFDHAG